MRMLLARSIGRLPIRVRVLEGGTTTSRPERTADARRRRRSGVGRCHNPHVTPEPRTGPERKAGAIARLEALQADVWVATASPSGVAHLVPLSYAWDGEHIILATEPRLPTARNLEATGRARLGFGPTRDVVLVDAVLDRTVDVAEAPSELADRYASQADWDPRLQKDPTVFFLLRIVRVQAWREANELAGRTLMRDGIWLV